MSVDESSERAAGSQDEAGLLGELERVEYVVRADLVGGDQQGQVELAADDGADLEGNTATK